MTLLAVGSHRDEQHRQRRNNSDSEEIHESTEEDEVGLSEGWTDYLISDSASVWNQEPRLQKFEEDGRQWDGEAAV